MCSAGYQGPYVCGPPCSCLKPLTSHHTTHAHATPNTPAAAPQVLPSLREHRDEVLLRELHNRWNNHKLMVRWLSRFFNYLDRWEGSKMRSRQWTARRTLSAGAGVYSRQLSSGSSPARTISAGGAGARATSTAAAVRSSSRERFRVQEPVVQVLRRLWPYLCGHEGGIVPTATV
jgi:hypothetical protein